LFFNFRKVDMNFKRLKALVAPLLVSLPLFAAAGPYSSMFVFGDSLSDTGNLFLATGGAQPPAGQPYFNGRFSNGPVWVEGLASALGLASNAAPYLIGGNNYAFAGARTGTSSPPPGVLAQVGGLWAPTHPLADPNALYVVVGGGNDMRDARTAFQTNSAADIAGRLAAAVTAVNNLKNAVLFLASSGAKNILISSLPDLGFTPEAALLGLQAASSDASADFNFLIGGLIGLEGFFSGLDIDLLDMAGVSAAVHANPVAYGITNTTSPCAGFAFSLGASCDTSLFSDALHPSAYAHSLIAREALVALDVPEPETLALFALAVAALVVTRRRSVQPA
jgi:outer membrane lipase/esterase